MSCSRGKSPEPPAAARIAFTPARRTAQCPAAAEPTGDHRRRAGAEPAGRALRHPGGDGAAGPSRPLRRRTSCQRIRRSGAASPGGARRARRLHRVAVAASSRLTWRGPVYWPYAYDDVFYYTFWPDAYDPGYWAYAYDDMFDGVFFPDGAPYDAYAAEGPYAGVDGRATTGLRLPVAHRHWDFITQATRDFCAEQAKGVSAWPLQQITDAVRLNEDQKSLLGKSAQGFRRRGNPLQGCLSGCGADDPADERGHGLGLQAIDEAVQTVKPALVAFYSSLNDEQKARFNEIGVQLGQPTLVAHRQGAAGRGQLQRREGRHSNLRSTALNRRCGQPTPRAPLWTSSTRRCRRPSTPGARPAPTPCCKRWSDAWTSCRSALKRRDRRRQHRAARARGVLHPRSTTSRSRSTAWTRQRSGRPTLALRF